MIRYPKLNKNGVSRVTVPLLEGGINQKDSASLINDNQLTDAKNVWFDGQTLRTRPAITQHSSVQQTIQYTVGTEAHNVKYAPKKHTSTIETTFQNEIMRFAFYYTDPTLYDSEVGADDLYIFATCLDKDGAFITNGFSGIVRPPIDIAGNHYTNENYKMQISVFKGTAKTDDHTFGTGLGIYVLCSVLEKATNVLHGCFMFELCYKIRTLKNHIAFKSLLLSTQNTNSLYAPLMYINGKGNKYSFLPITTSTEYSGSAELEGKNLLQSAMRFQFMTDGISNSFKLPISAIDNKEVTITVETSGMGFSISNSSSSKLKFTIPISASYSSEYYILDSNSYDIYTKNASNEYKLTNVALNTIAVKAMFDRSSGRLYFKQCAGTDFVPDTLTDFVFQITIENNIEITAYKRQWKQFLELCQMTSNEVFGGSDGLYGGSRTFLAGYKNKICRSEVNNPLYFSENNYVEVGNDDEQITALAKMGSSLIIFKSNSIYYMIYSSGDNVTAENVNAGSVVDITTTYAYFPIYQITNQYGCDFPNTIKLCLNRLIWVSSDGNVYTLVTQSNSSQRNIYCISSMIRRKFYGENGALLINSNAFSVNWGDYYILFCDGHAWALNYNKDSYRYVYSYTNKTNNSTTKYFTWWYWTTQEYADYIVIRDTLYLLKSNYTQTDSKLTITVDEVSKSDSEANCDCMIQSKIFDFSYPERYKSIEKISLGIGNDINSMINIFLLTDKGEQIVRPLITDSNSQQTRYSSEYGVQKNIIPSCKRAKRFGFRIESTGIMSIDNLVLFYKILGEVR